MRLVLYKSQADKDAGIAVDETTCDTLHKAKTAADMETRNGYWSEVFSTDGELVYTAYPEE